MSVESFLFREGLTSRTMELMNCRPALVRRVACVAAILSVVSVAPSVPGQKKTPERKPEQVEQWRALFDGNSMSGWKQIGAGGFTLKDRALVSEGGPGMLWYAVEKFSNCQIRVVFKLASARDDSGVFIRLPARPENPSEAASVGYEVEINNTGDPFHRTGCLHGVNRAQAVVLAHVGEWNAMIITLYGARTRIHVNGVQVTDHLEENRSSATKSKWLDDNPRRPDAGFIGLQNYDSRSRVSFKEVSVRALK